MSAHRLSYFWKTIVVVILAIMAFSYASNHLVTQTAIQKEKATLLNNAKLLSNLIGSVVKFDSQFSKEKEFSYSAKQATLSQINEAFKGYTKTAAGYEYLVGEIDHQFINYIAYSYKAPNPIATQDKDKAFAMRLALSGKTGVIETTDYSQQQFIAAYTPIPNTSWGLVVKQELSHFTQPFFETGLWVFLLSVLLATLVFYLGLKREHSFRSHLQQKEERFQHLVESSHDWVWEVDSQGVYTYSSEQIEKLLGFTPNEVIGKTPFDLMAPYETKSKQEFFTQLIAEPKEFINLENVNLHKDGHEVVLLTSGTPFFNSDGELLGYRGMDKDITTMKKHEEEITHIAYFDSLTGLANREQMMERIEEELAFCKRTDTVSVLLYLDLDGFKDINDSIGHDIGDEVLIETALRIKHELRSYDLAGRIGGDEFVLLLRYSSADTSFLYARLNQSLNRLLEKINSPIIIGEHSLQVGASIGVAFLPGDGEDIGEILRHADAAMYEAKRAGKNQYYYYHNDLQKVADEKLKLKKELSSAFEQDQFELYYQRQTNIDGRQTTGLEALIRWNHPTEGTVSPGYFLPYIEEFNLTAELDEWVMRNVCHDIKHDFAELLSDRSISFNLTPESFNKYDLMQKLMKHVEDYDVDPTQLTLEVTEGSLVQDMEQAHDMISALSMFGFNIALDDFGTGYSSLSYLSRLEFDTIKIDRNFIKNLEINTTDQNICRLIIGLARDLEVAVVAEGVENDKQVAFLRAHNIDSVQGFIYSKPATISETCHHLQQELIANKTPRL